MINSNKKIKLFLFLIFIFPAFTFAFVTPNLLGSPFGGVVVAVTPCVSSFSGSYAVEVKSFLGSETYVWRPSTKTYLFGAPKNPGQFLLGLATPLADGCPTSIIKGKPANFMGSFTMTMVGTSAI